MPKCGGSSFSKLLFDQFPNKFKEDNDFPIHKTFKKRTTEAKRARKWIEFNNRYLSRFKNTECIHGHFLPYKYDYLYYSNQAVFVTWLRDPVERLGSHYYFWQRTYNPWKSKPLHKKIMKENWSLEKFAFSDEVKNLYSKFLWNFPLDRFEFIGITEFYEDDLNHFAKKYLGLNDINIPKENVNPNNSKKYFEDVEMVEDLKAFHSLDYELYNNALKIREKRML